MKLTEMRQLLTNHGIILTKSLGQNFLHDGNQLARIVRAAQLQPTDRVMEIGPGLGPLTELLLAETPNVLAIEKDGRLVEVLKNRFPAKAGFELREADALRVLTDEPRDWTGWKLVSNLPYSVASPIIVELAQSEGPPDRIVATLQSEVVRRIAAEADGDDYGLLTLLVQLRYEVGEQFKIPATCFFPEPEVESSCIELRKRPERLLNQTEARVFTRIVKRGFSQRRKMMFKLMRGDWPEALLADAFLQMNLPRTIRAEAVPLEQFVGLAKFFAASRPN